MMSSFLMAAMFGLFGSLHCMAMCGGFACLGQACPKSSGLRQTSILIAFNLGRATTYITLASLISLLVSQAAAWLQVPHWAHMLRLLFALSLVAAGLHVIGNISILKPLEKVGHRAFSRLRPFASSLLPMRYPLPAFALGMCWGMLPCGLLYSAVLMAISHGEVAGAALTMLGFGLGTLPVMFGIGFFGTKIKRWIQERQLQRLAGVCMIVVGLGTSAMPAYALLKGHHGAHDTQTTTQQGMPPSCH